MNNVSNMEMGLINSFFERFFNSLMISVFVQIFTKEELEKIFDLTYKNLMDSFSAQVLMPMSHNDIGAVLQIKQKINSIFESNKKATLSAYDGPKDNGSDIDDAIIVENDNESKKANAPTEAKIELNEDGKPKIRLV